MQIFGTQSDFFFLRKVLFFFYSPSLYFAQAFLRSNDIVYVYMLLLFSSTYFSCSFSCQEFLSQPILFQVQWFLVLCILICISSLFSSLFPFLYNSCYFLWCGLRAHVTVLGCRDTLWNLWKSWFGTLKQMRMSL